jgi:hypothetical protein
MQETARITVTISKDVTRKLAELAGGESRIGEYLARLILRLHAKKSGQESVVDLEQAILEIHELLENEKMYKREIRLLEQRLSRALATQHKLLATVQFADQLAMRRANTVLH